MIICTNLLNLLFDVRLHLEAVAGVTVVLLSTRRQHLPILPSLLQRGGDIGVILLVLRARGGGLGDGRGDGLRD